MAVVYDIEHRTAYTYKKPVTFAQHRALFFHDEMSQPEKFRPYALPSRVWVNEVKQRLSAVTAMP